MFITACRQEVASGMARIDGGQCSTLTKETLDFEAPCLTSGFRSMMIETIKHSMKCGFKGSSHIHKARAKYSFH